MIIGMFNLNELIRETLRNSSDADPRALAQTVVAAIPDEYVREALSDCLVDRVRLQITRARMTGESLVAAPTIASEDDAPHAIVSAPIRAGRSRWAGMGGIPDREYVGGKWMMTADMTSADCELLAQEREKQAEELRATAAKWRRIAMLMRATGSATVKDIPNDTGLDAAA